MSYTVTVKNDSLLTNGQGSVHTWLELSDGSSNVVYFGFTPSGFGYFNKTGILDEKNYLKQRVSSEQLTIGITAEQYGSMAEAISKFKTSPPLYDLIPDGDGSDFNCTTAASFILKSAGIDFLGSVQSPFGVAAKINGNNDYTINDLVIDLDGDGIETLSVSSVFSSIMMVTSLRKSQQGLRQSILSA
ncbi:TPA: hypothetical protein ACTXAV_003331 [Raoultella planticola]|uniref:hypothetical protein n=1 Tax=Raoultella planticola TaxID=575 RepID=UPI000FD9A0B6|nr:hypothetical protein [Raoultella planticola]ELU0692400.1 hypothetical protein [Raoultella planticola]HED2620387.1 hypothetical protein [Raoultella planticola]HEH6361190.1 hypothetical protein [Raoultella planticola]